MSIATALAHPDRAAEDYAWTFVKVDEMLEILSRKHAREGGLEGVFVERLLALYRARIETREKLERYTDMYGADRNSGGLYRALEAYTKTLQFEVGRLYAEWKGSTAVEETFTDEHGDEVPVVQLPAPVCDDPDEPELGVTAALFAHDADIVDLRGQVLEEFAAADATRWHRHDLRAAGATLKALLERIADADIVLHDALLLRAEGHSFKTIAARVGTSSGALRQRVRRAFPSFHPTEQQAIVALGLWTPNPNKRRRAHGPDSENQDANCE